MSTQLKRLYEFGDYQLDTEERVLLRHRHPVALTPKAYELLLALVKKSGHILEKDDLLKEVWPDSFVEEANLAVNISSLRKTLGDKPEGGQYIETIQRRGYRFNAKVLELEVQASRQRETAEESALTSTTAAGVSESNRPHSPGQSVLQKDDSQTAAAEEKAISFLQWARQSKSRAVILAASGIAIVAVTSTLLIYKYVLSQAPAKPRKLAILPFRNNGQNVDADFLSFSLADAIITRLGYVSELTVRPSSYVGKYRNTDIDLKAVAKELRVDVVLTGTYLKDGDSLRITAQLIDVNEDLTIWNQPPKDWKYDKLSTIHDEVAQQIIAGLQLKLTSDEDKRLKREVSSNPEAYELYLRGVDLYQTNRFTSALESLEQAVSKDPAFALARAHLGRAYSARAAFQLGGEADYKRAQESYDKALALNPDQIEAHIFKANLMTDTGRAGEAIQLLREVLVTNENLAEAHWELGYAYRFGGLLKESIEECERARQIDPEVKLYSSALNAYLYNGEYEKFYKTLPDRDIAYIVFYKGLANYYMNNQKQAAAHFDRAADLSKEVYTRIGKAFSLAISGKNKEGINLLLETRQMIEERNVSDAEAIYKVAQAYAMLGDKPSALHMFRRSIEGGFYCYPYFKSDSLLQNIRSEPEYARLLELARVRHEEFKSQFFK
jgi:DNA-binding winged helix-turn-helix (wHTH) protein/TolB-like protein/Flp pilus assembly protein TadD